MANEYKEDVEAHNKKLEEEITKLSTLLNDKVKELDYLKTKTSALKHAKRCPDISDDAVDDLQKFHNVEAFETLVDLCEYEMIFNIGLDKRFRDALKKRYPHQFSAIVGIEPAWDKFDKEIGKDK